MVCWGEFVAELCEKRTFARAIAVNFAPAVRPGVFPGLQFWRLRIWRLALPDANSQKTFDVRGYVNHGVKVLAGATPEPLKLEFWNEI